MPDFRWFGDGGWRALSLAALLVAVVVTVTDGVGEIGGDARVYVEAARSIGEGAYEAPSEPSGVPRYPPGFPLLLAPFVAAWGEGGARAASAVIGGLLVVSVWQLARVLGGHRAAALAAVLWTASPLVRDFSTDVMSDPAGALLVVAAILASITGRWMLTGLALGGSSWVRLIHVTFIVGVGRRRAAWVGAAVALVPLAVFQLRTYGRLAGYDGGEAQFSLSYVFDHTPLIVMTNPSPWPNWQFVPGLLWGLQRGLVPMLPIFAAVELVARRREAPARLAAWILLVNVLVYVPYFFQASRFVLPAACVLIAFSAAGMVRVVDRLREGDRPPASVELSSATATDAQPGDP